MRLFIARNLSNAETPCLSLPRGNCQLLKEFIVTNFLTVTELQTLDCHYTVDYYEPADCHGTVEYHQACD